MPSATVKFGIQTGLANVEWSQLPEFWRFLDQETAFHSAWTFDHFLPPGPGQDPTGPCLEGWTALAALAQATQRLRLGCLVTGNTYRHPAVLAKMAATIDHISNGRLEFGLGAAWHQEEHSAYGIPFFTLKERQDRLEEAVQLIRLLFQAESPVDFQGRYYQLRQAPFSPPCVQKPHPPIMVGGGGEKRTLRTLARYGDMMNVFGAVSAVKRKIDILEAHCRDAGRDPGEIEKSVSGIVFVSDDRDLVERILKPSAQNAGVSVEQARRELPIGSAEHVREVIQEYADIGVSYIIMMAIAPYNFKVYRRISEQVVEAFQ